MAEEQKMEGRMETARGRRGGRGRGRGEGRRKDARGPTGFEAQALDFARAIDKPIVKGDFAAQLEPLENFVLAVRKGGKPRRLEDLPDASRGKEIGRASCRERVEIAVVAVAGKK